MDRSEVYKLIDGERDYQNTKWPRDHEHEAGAYVAMIHAYSTKALIAWTDNPGDEAALDVIRKIAGICVRAMEKHGAPPRS